MMRKATKGMYTIPAARREAVNKALASVGLGDDFFSVPLIKGAGRKATHYGASASLLPSQQRAFDVVMGKENNATVERAVEKLSRGAFASKVLTKQGVKIQSVEDRVAEIGGGRGR